MSEHSALADVQALDRALALIRARDAGDDAYREALARTFREINELVDAQDRGEALAGLVTALVRFSVTCAGTHTLLERAELVDVVYRSLCESSIELEPA